MKTHDGAASSNCLNSCCFMVMFSTMASTTKSHDPILLVGSCDILIIDMVPVVKSLAACNGNECYKVPL